MLDWAVIMTPVLVLGVLLLVGYAGCEFDPSGSGVITTDPLFPTPGLYMVVRIPTALTVNAIQYTYSLNGGTPTPVTDENPTPGDTEDQGAIGVYAINCGTGYGTWNLVCGVAVDQADFTYATAIITIDDGVSERPKANFSAPPATFRGFES